MRSLQQPRMFCNDLCGRNRTRGFLSTVIVVYVINKSFETFIHKIFRVAIFNRVTIFFVLDE